MIQYLKKNKAAVNLEDTPLATPGGEGSVYKIINMPNYCAKIYHPDQLSKERERKIEYLIKHHTHQQINDKALICWPIDLVYNKSGSFAGFIMPLAFANSIELYEIVTTNINAKLNFVWKTKFNRSSLIGIQNRLKVCVNIAIALHILHQTKQYVLVDFKPKNILITIDGKVSITDIDSIQVFNNGQVLHYAKVATSEYAPKESEKLNPANDLIPESWDRFSLAVVFYEILFGIHPYAATAIGQYDSATTIDDKIRKSLFVHGSKKSYLSVIPIPHTNYLNLPKSIQELFIRAFEIGASNPLQRPSAEEWGKIIIEELNRSNLKPNNPQPPTLHKTISDNISQHTQTIIPPTVITTPIVSSTNKPSNYRFRWGRFVIIILSISAILFVINKIQLANNSGNNILQDTTSNVNKDTSEIENIKSFNAEDYFNKGNELLQQERYKEAVTEFTNAININPNYSMAYNGRGDANLYLGNNNKAISNYSKAIEISPNYAEAYDNRGHAKYNIDDKEGGCNDWSISCNLGFQKGCSDYQLCR